MVAHAERRSHLPLGNRFAQQEFSGGAAVLVIVVDQVVVRRLKPVIFVRLVADRHRRVEQFRARVDLVGLGEERLDRIAGSGRALKVDVIGEDAHDNVDQGLGQSLLERGFIEALVEAHAARFAVLRGSGLAGGLSVAPRDRRIGAAVVDRDGRFELVVGIDRRRARSAASRPACRGSSGRRRIFCPSPTGDSPCLTPKAARMAVAASAVAPFAFSTSSKLSPWRIWIELLARRRVLRSGRLRHVGDVLGDHAHFDRSKRRVRAHAADGCI